jgi:hypothetical protein
MWMRKVDGEMSSGKTLFVSFLFYGVLGLAPWVMVLALIEIFNLFGIVPAFEQNCSGSKDSESCSYAFVAFKRSGK